MPEGYKGVSLPEGLLQQVEDLLKDLEKEGFDHGYKTITEFVKDSIRRRVEDLRQIYFIGEKKTQ